MAYKNKKKNKAHVAKLQTTGWRASEQLSRKKQELRTELRRYINDKQEIEKIIERRYPKI